MAGLKYGLLTGIVMAVSMLVADWVEFGMQTAAPENFVTDIVLLLGLLMAAYRYRHSLPDERVTLKELLLLGLWVGFIASLVYGLLLWFYGALDETLVTRFIDARLAQMTSDESDPSATLNIQLVKGYTAGDWGFIGGFRSAVMSILMNLVAALLFRTEKAPVRSKS